jgi:hypothetical protein
VVLDDSKAPAVEDKPQKAVNANRVVVGVVRLGSVNELSAAGGPEAHSFNGCPSWRSSRHFT